MFAHDGRGTPLAQELFLALDEAVSKESIDAFLLNIEWLRCSVVFA